MAEKNSKKWLLIGGIGCLGIVLIIAICCGGSAFFGWQQLSDIRGVGDQFLTEVKEGDYQGAYDSASMEWQQAQSEEEFVAFMTAVESRAGRLQDWSFRGFNMDADQSGTNGELNYAATYANESGSINLLLVKEGDQWKVLGATFNAPSLGDLE